MAKPHTQADKSGLHRGQGLPPAFLLPSLVPSSQPQLTGSLYSNQVLLRTLLPVGQLPLGDSPSVLCWVIIQIHQGWPRWLLIGIRSVPQLRKYRSNETEHQVVLYDGCSLLCGSASSRAALCLAVIFTFLRALCSQTSIWSPQQPGQGTHLFLP